MAESQAPAEAASAVWSALSQSPADVHAALDKVESLGSELPLIQHMTQVMPVPDFFFGGGMLLLIVLIHATGMRMLTDRFEMRVQALGHHGSTWRPDLLLGGVVLLMLLLHLVEIWVWSAALVDNWRAASFFTANTYTTVGYGNFLLPDGWHMPCRGCSPSAGRAACWSRSCAAASRPRGWRYARDRASRRTARRRRPDAGVPGTQVLFSMPGDLVEGQDVAHRLGTPAA